MWDFSVFLHADAWIALATLTALEIVLGIDNIVFISILTGKLPEEQQARARTLGLALALLARLGLLFAISWIVGLTQTLFEVAGQEISGRDLVLGGGGLFLLAKATHEIFENLEAPDDDGEGLRKVSGFASVLVQILLLDIVFSLDSVITAVGMADHFVVMAIAVVIAVIVMLFFAGAISRFIHRHPSMKVLALSFLLMIGVLLVAESLDQHVNKGYIYFAMAFSLIVELLNIRARRVSAPPAPAEP